MFIEKNVDLFEEIIDRYRSGENGKLFKPGFGAGSIADIPSILKGNLGIGGVKAVPEVMKGASGEVDHMVFFLLDGFGHSTVEYALQNMPMHNLRKFMEHCEYTPITSVFPSTTSTATVTYQTDLHPSRHGIIGYNSYLSEIGTVCNMISLTPVGRPGYSLLDHGWDVPAIGRSGTIYEEFGRNYIDPFLYLPSAIKGSGMTRITGSGASITGYVSVSQMLTALRRNISGSVRKSFHFCYIPTIDTISHKIGPYTEETAMEMDSIFQLINEQFLEMSGHDGDLGILVSADHGHTVIPHGNVRDVRDDPVLRAMLRAPVAGDFRAPILRVRMEKLEEACSHLEEHYGKDYVVKRSRDALKEGYFGSTSGEIADQGRFGDIVMFPVTASGLMDSSLAVLDEKLGRFDLVGMHGGLSREEMIVPLISGFTGGRQ